VRPSSACGAAAAPCCCPLLLLPAGGQRPSPPWKLLALHLGLRTAASSAPAPAGVLRMLLALLLGETEGPEAAAAVVCRAGSAPAAGCAASCSAGAGSCPSVLCCCCCCALGAMGSSSMATNCGRVSGRWHSGPRAMHSATTCMQGRRRDAGLARPELPGRRTSAAQHRARPPTHPHPPWRWPS
jgi:hypothetical protein